MCVAVGAEKQCELTCRPAGYRFYVRLAERVRDGTPCFNVSSNDVCVEGRCLVSVFKGVCVGDFSFRCLSPSCLVGVDNVQNPLVAFRLRVSPIFFFYPALGLYSVSFSHLHSLILPLFHPSVSGMNLASNSYQFTQTTVK